MTQERKAELQRKLAIAPVAKPPSGLAERIKADIPRYLDARRDRERLSRSMAFPLRVAASVVLLITSVFLTIQMLSRDERSLVTVTGSGPAPSPLPAQVEPTLPEAAPAAEADRQIAPATVPAEPPPVALRRRDEARQAPAAAVAREEKKDEREDPQPAAAGRISRDAGPRSQSVAKLAAAESDVAQSGMAESAVADAAAPAAPPAQFSGVARTMKKPAAATAITPSAAPLERTTKAIFGISIDPGAFARVKEIIERGEKPAPVAVDVAALVNHFAGPPERAPREVQLQVEASSAPLSSDRAAVIRYTVDSAVAARAELSVMIEEEAVEWHRVVTPAGTLGRSEQMLRPHDSVTGLLEVRMDPKAWGRQRVATIKLRYDSPSGRPEEIQRVVRAGDLGRSWASASRRHRLATLGALWGESLRGEDPQGEIARAATDLAGEAPDDVRAGELAAAATASSRPRSSGPTGSGR